MSSNDQLLSVLHCNIVICAPYAERWDSPRKDWKATYQKLAYLATNMCYCEPYKYLDFSDIWPSSLTLNAKIDVTAHFISVF